jgi:imidazole glycerol-phosphate synthase subunit HisF
MKNKRVIPIFTYRNNVLVKSINYSNYRNVNSVIPVIKLFNKRNIDEMIFLNLNNEIDFNLLSSFVNEVDYPITYGGNINSIDTMKKIYNLGFDKISLNSILYTDPDFSIKACKLFGKQSITASIDVKKHDDNYYCYYHNGKINSNLKIEEHLKNIIEKNTIAEIVVTNIDYDGTFKGFDTNLYKKLENFNIRILSNGGGCYDEKNIINNASINNNYGLCFSSLFFFKQYIPNDIKKILYNNNFNCANYKF